MNRMNCLDLFAGCGGLSIGLVQAGIQVRWANEIDAHAAETYRRSHPECAVFEEDVNVLYRRLLDRDTDLPRPGDVDLVAGGPPCQGFSGYNPHRSAADPRNSLVESFLDVVAHLKPRYVLMENVPGMLSLDKGRVPTAVLTALESLGYQARLGILQAGYYGVPQNRWRVFIVAAAAGLRVPEFPLPVHAFPRTTIFGATAFRANVVKPPNAKGDLFWQPAPTVTVWNAISDLPEIPNGGGADDCDYAELPKCGYQESLRVNSLKVFNHRCTRLGELMLARCKAIPKRPGAGWLDLPEHLKPKNLLRHGDRRYDNRFGRLHWEGTFNTILTQALPYWGRVIHPEQDRVISIRESARAQGFDDLVRFFGPQTSCYEQVGNAVPPPLGRALGRALVSAAECVIQSAPEVVQWDD
jgi:DNA (cytosine-5)-methyltransferase 1